MEDIKVKAVHTLQKKKSFLKQTRNIPEMTHLDINETFTVDYFQRVKK